MLAFGHLYVVEETSANSVHDSQYFSRCHRDVTPEKPHILDHNCMLSLHNACFNQSSLFY